MIHFQRILLVQINPKIIKRNIIETITLQIDLFLISFSNSLTITFKNKKMVSLSFLRKTYFIRWLKRKSIYTYNIIFSVKLINFPQTNSNIQESMKGLFFIWKITVVENIFNSFLYYQKIHNIFYMNLKNWTNSLDQLNI